MSESLARIAELKERARLRDLQRRDSGAWRAGKRGPTAEDLHLRVVASIEHAAAELPDYHDCAEEGCKPPWTHYGMSKYGLCLSCGGCGDPECCGSHERCGPPRSAPGERLSEGIARLEAQDAATAAPHYRRGDG